MPVLRLRQRFNPFIFDLATFLLSTLLIILLSGDFMGWSLVPAFVCTAGVSLVRLLVHWPMVLGWCKWMGSISAALFVCHPITRKIFIPISREGDVWAGLLLYAVASVCLAWLFRLLLNKIPNPTLRQ